MAISFKQSLYQTYVLGGKLGIVADKTTEIHQVFLLMETNA